MFLWMSGWLAVLPVRQLHSRCCADGLRAPTPSEQVIRRKRPQQLQHQAQRRARVGL